MALILALIVALALANSRHSSAHTADIEGFARQYVKATDADSSDRLAFLRIGQQLCAEKSRGDFNMQGAVNAQEFTQLPRGFVNIIYRDAVENLCPWRKDELGIALP